MSRILLKWFLWLLCLLPWLAHANPLAMPSDDDLFAGEYSHPELSIQITKSGQHYQGEIRRGDQRYPFKTSRQDKVLRGFFNDGQQHYPMRVLHQDHKLILETGQVRYQLNRMSPATSQATLPPQPLSMPTPTSPMPTPPLSMPSAMPTSPMPPLSMPSAMPTSPLSLPSAALSAGIQSTAAPLGYTALSIGTGLQLHQFVGGLRYWLSGAVTEPQAVYLMQAHLRPEADILAKQLQQLETLLGATLLSEQLQVSERQYVSKLIELSGKGVKFFQDWRSLLDDMLRLRHAGKQPELVELTAARLPLAVNGSVAYLRDFTLLVRATGGIQDVRDKALPDSASLAPEKILKWEMLRNMSDAMREGMDIFKLWQGR